MPVSLDSWASLCKQAFRGDEHLSEFIVFIDRGKTGPDSDGNYTWICKDTRYRDHFISMGIQPGIGSTFTLGTADLIALNSTKNQMRTEHHNETQVILQAHMAKLLKDVSTIDLSHKDRLTLIEEFMNAHQGEDTAQSLLSGLNKFFRYQLQNKSKIVEWRIYQDSFMQYGQQYMEDYIRLFKGILGLQLAYEDDNTSIAMEGPGQPIPHFIWRMNPTITNNQIKDIIRSIGMKGTGQQGFNTSLIPRAQHQTGVIHWICKMITHCLSSIFRF
ncbi:hypothetical protein BDB01DRAFT_786047 [Pilobolus umbonatus]|nr:hypothetical protein BDB01DRAFT_786047 [Pilobolus umbonatus]